MGFLVFGFQQTLFSRKRLPTLKKIEIPQLTAAVNAVRMALTGGA